MTIFLWLTEKKPFFLVLLQFKIFRVLSNNVSLILILGQSKQTHFSESHTEPLERGERRGKTYFPLEIFDNYFLAIHSSINRCFVLFLTLVNSSHDWERLFTVLFPVYPPIKFVSLTSTWIAITGVTLLANTFERTVSIGAICIWVTIVGVRWTLVDICQK